MLKKRLIPKLLIKFNKNNNPVLVNSFQYNKFKLIGNPVSQAKIFEAQHADQLILLNIDKQIDENNNTIINLLNEFSKKIFMPLTFGGGIRKINIIELLLKSGADKICINSIAIKNDKFVSEASKIFGKQCIVVSIDFKFNGKFYEVYENGGKNPTGLDVIEWSKKIQELGAGEIILSDINLDGTGEGLNLDVSKTVSNNLEIPVIISSGCGKAEHFINGFKNTNVQGIAAGNFFSNKDQNIYQTRSQLINNNIPLRKI